MTVPRVMRLLLIALGVLFFVDGVADLLRRGPWGLLGTVGGALIVVGVIVDASRERRRSGGDER